MRGTQWIGAGLGIVILVVFLLLPPLAPLTELGMKTLGIFLFVIFWWAFVDVGFSSLLCLAFLALTGVMTPQAVFAESFGSWLVIFILSCFGLTEAIRLSGFSRRFALWFLTRPFTTGHPWLLLMSLFLGVTIMGAVLSATVTVIIFLAIVIPMLEAMGYKKGDRFASTLVMGLSWVASVSFIMTPIGHGSNLLAMEWVLRDTGYSIDFLRWSLVGIPVGLMGFLVVLGVFRYIVRPDTSKFRDMANRYINGDAGKIEPMKPEEKIALGVFGLVFLVWMSPSLVGGILPGLSTYLTRLGYAVPPLVGAVLLCITRVRNRPLLTFHQWMTGVEWGSIALIAAIMAIGSVIGKPETGIPQLLTGFIQPVVNNAPFYVVVLVSVFWVVLQTNIMSNLVSASLVYTVMMPAVITAGIGNPMALGFTIFGGSHYAFSLPSATTTTAIVVGSGWVPVNFLVRYGILLIVPMVLLFTFVVYPFAGLIYR